MSEHRAPVELVKCKTCSDKVIEKLPAETPKYCPCCTIVHGLEEPRRAAVLARIKGGASAAAALALTLPIDEQVKLCNPTERRVRKGDGGTRLPKPEDLSEKRATKKSRAA